MGEDNARSCERLVSIECAYCGTEVAYSGGRRPQYCSGTCRSRAWELRRAANRLDRGNPMPTVVREVVERTVERDRPVPVPIVPRLAEDWAPMLEELERQVREDPLSLMRRKNDFQELAAAVKSLHSAFTWRTPEPVETAPETSGAPAAASGTLSRQQRRALERQRRKQG